MMSHPPRGFAALLPVLILSTILVSTAALASQDAYAVRVSVLHSERIAKVDAAARSCATSVLLRIMQSPLTTIPKEDVMLGGGTVCTIERIERFADHYQIYTSAKVGDAYVGRLTTAYLENQKIVRVVLRKI